MRYLKSLAWLFAATCALAQDYGGPAILSRGQAPSNVQSISVNVLRPYVSVESIYDTGLAGYTLDPTNHVPDLAGPGVEVGFGVDGSHSWRHTSLNLDYRGTYRHYTNQSYYNGSDNILSLGIMHQNSRRLQFTWDAAAGTFTRAFGFGTLGYNPFVNNLVNNNIFDNRVNYLQTSGRVTYLKSARLSLSATANGYLVRRASSSLYGVTGSSASGDIIYRYSRFGSIGVDYRFDHFDFTKVFGSTNVHTVALQWALRLGRRWELSTQLGGSRVEFQTLQLVSLDPVIAAILGTSRGVAAVYGKSYAPAVGGRLTRSFNYSSLQVAYNRGVMAAGNGLYATVRHENENLGYSYTGLRKWNFGLNLEHDTMSSIGGQYLGLGNYSSEVGGLGFTRAIGQRNLHVIGSFQVRRFDVSHTQLFGRLQYRTTIGFAYSPGDLPLSLW